MAHQELFTLLIVGAAAALLIRDFIRTLRGRSRGCGQCAAGGNCSDQGEKGFPV